MVNKLPEKLSMLRKHYGYSQGDIANKLNIPVTEYMNWENGNKICTIKQLKVLSDLFHVSLDAMADNQKDIVIAKDNLGDSVNIPFLSTSTPNSLTQQMDVADNMMPVSSVVQSSDPQRTLQMTSLKDATNDLQQTRDLQQVRQAQQEPEPVKHVEEKKPTPKKKDKKMMTAIVAGVSVVAIILVFVLMNLFMGGGKTSVSVSTINRLAEGSTYTLYVDQSGRLKSYGAFSSTSAFNGVVQVSAYKDHAMGLKKDGTVTDTTNDVSSWKNITMVASGMNHSVGLKSDGSVTCTGSTQACSVDDWSNITNVYAGNEVTVGISEDGSVHTSGSVNSSITNQSNVASIAMNDDMMALVNKDGTVTTYAIGSKAAFDTSSWASISSVAVGDDAIIGLKKDGTLEVKTDNTDLETTLKSWSNIRYIAANKATYVAVDGAGKLYGAGDNTYNQYEADISATPTPEATKLSSPKNIQVETTTANISIKWDSVENADYYEVALDGGTPIKAASNSTSVSVSELEEGKEYRISVTACTDNTEEYESSDPAETRYTYESLSQQLASVSNINGKAYSNYGTSEWILSWDPVENASYYIVNLDGGPDQKVDTNTISIDLTHTNVTNNTTHNIQVTAYSDSTAYTTSEPTKVALQYTVNTYNITINFVDKNSDYKSVASNLPLAEGIYKVSQYWKDTDGYRLVDAEQTFEVKNGTVTFEFAVTNTPLDGN